jgi:8-oxo-dGTP pyrophosphatase MutT (NUDIX family)
VGFPGGHKSVEDQGFLETAIRETREEVGIDLNEHELVGSLPFVAVRSRRVEVAPFVFALRRTVAVQPNNEVAESFWIPLTNLQEFKVTRQRERVGEAELDVDAYVYHGYVIWGLTFRIINLLLNRNWKRETDL